MTWDSSSKKDPWIVNKSVDDKILFYSGRAAEGPTDYFQIGRAVSANGGSTLSFDTSPVIALGGSGSPDEKGAFFPTVSASSLGNWFAVYGGYDGSLVSSICSASSTDEGATWTKNGALLTPLGTGNEVTGIIPGFIIWDGTKYVLFYAGAVNDIFLDCSGWRILSASISSDGETVVRNGPVLLPKVKAELTSSLAADSVILHVDDSSGFTPNRQFGISDGSSITWMRCKTVDSSTQITATCPSWKAFSSGAIVASVDSGSLFPRGLVALQSGGFRMYITAFQQFTTYGPVHAPFCERVISATASSLNGPWTIDDDLGIITGRDSSLFSNENLAFEIAPYE